MDPARVKESAAHITVFSQSRVPNAFRSYQSVVSISERLGLLNLTSPTRVVYAFTTPMRLSMREGAMPRPVQKPPALGFEDVTNGYVPKSMSSSVAWPPSSRILLPAR